DKLVGHVVVERAGTLESDVRPCAFRKVAENKDLPPDGRCELASLAMGLRLKVALDPALQNRPVDSVLKRLAQDRTAPFELADPLQPGWFLKPIAPPAPDGPLYLTPSQGLAVKADKVELPRYGPYPADKLPEELPKSLGRIARAQNLLTLAAATEQDPTRTRNALDIEVTLHRYRDAKDEDGEEIKAAGRSRQVRAGDQIAVEVSNPGMDSVDVTILRIDSNYGIEDIYPRVN